jgi:hypothetical protein
MKDNYLIWSVAFGSRGKRLAPIWVDAVRGVGEWRHDMLILGDAIATEGMRGSVKAIDITKDVARRYGLKPTEWTHWTINNMKAQIVHYVDPANYRYMLYTDIDVLVNSAHLEQLVALRDRQQLICVQEDMVPLSRKKMPALEKLGAPDRAEYRRWSQRPICAGIIGFPSSPAGLNALRDYGAACVEMRFEKSDQAKLVAILNRNYEGVWSYIGESVHGRRAWPAYPETFIHFTGQRDSMLIAYYLIHHKRLGLIRRAWVCIRFVAGELMFALTRKSRVRAYWRSDPLYKDASSWAKE